MINIIKHIILFLLFGIHIAVFAQPTIKENNFDWREQYTDPVSLAKAYIENEDFKVYWNPTFKTLLNLQYKVGFTTALIGGRYILLESPSLSLEIAKGGVYAITDISYDGLIEIIKCAIKTPDIVCERIAQTTIKEGVKAYNKAYEIANNYKKTGLLNRNEAYSLLLNMYKSQKLGLARRLYIDSQEEYSINNAIAEQAIIEVLNQLESLYKSKLDINNKLPILEAANFIHDLSKILKSKKIGLESYDPYIKYVENITKKNKAILEELKRLGGIKSSIKESLDENLIVPGKSVGQINSSTTIKDLINIYGKENIKTKSERVSSESKKIETLTYVHNNIIINWKDPINLTSPIKITIKYEANQFYTKEGIKTGTSVQELKRINGRSFDYRDIGVEPYKIVTDWQGGRLENYGKKVRNSWLIKLDYYVNEIVEIVVFIHENSEVSSLKILNPKGGESYKKGQKILIAWEAKKISGNLHIFLKSPNESKLLAIYNIIQSDSMWVDIPYTINNGTKWCIQLIAKSATGDIQVQSEKLSIWGSE